MTFSRTLLARSLAASIFFAAISTLPAQSVVTDPVGFTTINVNPQVGAAHGFTAAALNMFRPTAYRSVVTSVSTVGGVTVLTFPANSFTANQFTGTGNACFVEIAPTGTFANGTGSGVISDITANDTSTITLADNVTALITGGTSSIKVRPHWTVSTAFGAAGGNFLQGNTPFSADTITTYNVSTGAPTVYFYRTGFGWRTSLNADATNAVIHPDSGFLIERKSTSTLSFTVVGEVKLGPLATTIAGGNPNGNFVFAPNPFPLASVTLANSGLYTGSPTTGFADANTPFTADTLTVYNGAVPTVYFYRTGVGWRTSTNVDATNVTIPEGAAVLINRKSGRPTFQWFIPQPSMNL
jgi:uncharacterized protein (TIGR02597 family)